MARVFVTGSSGGLGQLAARKLVDAGHDVVLHARNRDRAREAAVAVPGARHVVVGDLASLDETRGIAGQVNAIGPCDAVIHNAGVGYQEARRETADGVEHIFAVNVLAAYVLTALVEPPTRLVYLTSGMHRSGDADLSDLSWRRRRWNAAQAYSDSKLFDVVLAFAIARLWPGVLSNAVEPGWVPTKMGGRDAPDDLQQGAETQVWLAVSSDPAARVSGRCFYHKQPKGTHPAASDPAVQDELFDVCEQLSGVILPERRRPS